MTMNKMSGLFMEVGAIYSLEKVTWQEILFRLTRES